MNEEEIDEIREYAKTSIFVLTVLILLLLGSIYCYNEMIKAFSIGPTINFLFIMPLGTCIILMFIFVIDFILYNLDKIWKNH